MRASVARWVRQAGLAVVITLSSAATAAAAQIADAPTTPDEVTEADIEASNGKIKAGYGALVSMWSADFQQLGVRFMAPGLLRYRGAVRTSCGIMPANNAMYCPSRNAIYFDEVFVARQAKAAARALGTDGDMVAVGIIAHEMGHAVAIQLGETSRVPYENEATADCLAGAFTQHAKRDGTLEPGDLEEAFFGMAAAGDPTPEFTGNQRIDSRISLRAALLGHGTREQRQANFKAGLDGGERACLTAFRT
jgi:predicted metalloprotease